VDLSAYPYKVLETKDDFKFDCGDADLNEFFLIKIKTKVRAP